MRIAPSSPKREAPPFLLLKQEDYTKEYRSFAQPPPQSQCLFASQTPAAKTTITTNWMLQNTHIQMQHDADYLLINRNGTGLFQYRSREEENDHGFTISQQRGAPVGVSFLLFLIWGSWGVFFIRPRTRFSTRKCDIHGIHVIDPCGM